MKRSALAGIFSFLIAVGVSAVDLDTNVSVEVSLSMTWAEFCLLRDYFKTKLAEELIDDDWRTISSSRVVLHDIDKHCPAKDRTAKVEDLVIFISPSPPASDKVDVTMTQKAYKILYYVWENKIDGALGMVFRNKITNVEAKGKKAPEEPSEMSETTRTFIAIGIAAAVIAAILIVMGIVYFCKKLTKKRKSGETSGYRSGYDDTGVDNRVLEGDPEAFPDNGAAVTMENGNQPIKTNDDDDNESTKL